MSTASTLYTSPGVSAAGARHVTLLDLIDRLLAGGVVIQGRITLAAADIDLVELDLGILLAAVREAGAR